MELTKTDKISKFLIKVVAFICGIAFLLILIVGGITIFNISPKDSNSKKKVEFVIESGWGQSKILEELEKKDIIKSAFFAKIYTKLEGSNAFYAGTYLLSPSMSVEEIVTIITSGNSLENESITVTFVEGKRFPYYVSKIASTFGYTEEEILTKTRDEEYLKKLINKYWFIESDILNKKLYYPLEGYIFPDTYSFKKSATIEEIIEVMLDEMGNKLSVYESEIKLSGRSIHSLLTMASMVELEAVTAEDRLVVSGVFYNRLNKNIAMGSDVTTYYAVKKDLTESLYMSEINGCNAYNTRGNCAEIFPVGPICSSSLSSITAAITPDETEYLYFVADTNNKLYFSKTNDEQLLVIKDLRNKNLWPE